MLYCFHAIVLWPTIADQIIGFCLLYMINLNIASILQAINNYICLLNKIKKYCVGNLPPLLKVNCSAHGVDE